jgi:hypothetical protein
MTIFDEAQILRNGAAGLPGNPGKFAEKHRVASLADAGLGSGPALGDARPAKGRAFIETALHNWEPNTEDFSFPQANDLEKVMNVVDIVEADANTNDAIADSLGIAPRTGAYYATAAGYMGLVEKYEHDTLQQFGLTSLGQTMRDLNATERTELMSEMVLRLDAVEVLNEGGTDALEKELARDNDWEDSTVDRRSACISSWHAAANDREALVNSHEEQAAHASLRYEAAARMAGEQKADARRKVEASKPRNGAICGSCFTEMSLSGACDNCD